MDKPTVFAYGGLDVLSHAAALHAVDIIKKRTQKAVFTMALSGGSTPRPFHRLLATAYRGEIPWDQVHLFWSDERFVPADDDESNYGMACETLIDHVPIPRANVHPIVTTFETPEAAAYAYERSLHELFGATTRATFDLAILGMGPDGHTASLFPGSPVLHEQQRWVHASEAPPDAAIRDRITLTFPFLNQSRHVVFLVSGRAKHDALDAVVNHPESARATHPAARITARKSLTWFVDEEALKG